MRRFLGGIVFFLAGIGMSYGALKLHQRQASFEKAAVRATGQVVDLVAKRGSDSTTWSAKVTFADASGRTLTFVNPSSSSPPGYRRGDSVRVLYDPSNPEFAQIDSWFNRWGGFTILGSMGAIFVLIGGSQIFGLSSRP